MPTATAPRAAVRLTNLASRALRRTGRTNIATGLHHHTCDAIRLVAVLGIT